MTDIIARPLARPLARPPFDPELAAALALLGETLPPTLTPEMIPFMRQAPLMTLDENLLAEREITRRDVTIRGYDGDDILVTVMSREGHDTSGPGIYHTHGGGMIVGDRFTGIESLIGWIDRHDAVVVTVEY